MQNRVVRYIKMSMKKGIKKKQWLAAVLAVFFIASLAVTAVAVNGAGDVSYGGSCSHGTCAVKWYHNQK